MLFGTTGTARAWIRPGADPTVAGFLRVLIASPLMFAASVHRLGFNEVRRQLASLPKSWVVATGLGVAAYQYGFFQGLQRTGVAVGTVLAIGSGPVFAGLLSTLIFRERPNRTWLFSTMFAIAGCALLSLGAVEGSAQVDGLGIALVLLAGFGYAFYTVLIRAATTRGLDSTLVLNSGFAFSVVLLSPTLVTGDTAWLTERRGVVLAIYLGVFPTALAYALFARGLKTLSSATVTSLVLAEPAVAVALAWAVLDEPVPTIKLLGILLVGVATLVLLVDARRLGSSESVGADQTDHSSDD